MIEIHFLFLLIPVCVFFIWIKDVLARKSKYECIITELNKLCENLKRENTSLSEKKDMLAKFNGNLSKERYSLKEKLEQRERELCACKARLETLEYEAAQTARIVLEEEARQTALAARDMDAVPAPETLDDVQQQIFNKLKYGNRNIFIQGQAGTGKSAFVAYLKKHLDKKIIFTAPTGIAAQNIGGSTLHSTFLLPPENFFYPSKVRLDPRVEILLQHTEMLIIDEISMVRPDMLDTIDTLTRKSRDSDEPFGGLQVLLIGDLLQLPPVVKGDEAKAGMYRFYGRELPFFFDASAYENGYFSKFTLEKIYRQSDEELQKNLCNLRQQENVQETLRYFNADIFDATLHEGVITITPTNAAANNINLEQLNNVEGKQVTYTYKMHGSYTKISEKDYPAPKQLFLKVGARVIFKRNISADCMNGTMGKVVSLEEDIIRVRLNSGKECSVQRYEWIDTSYYYDSSSMCIEESIDGRFVQFPLQLGYALTVHKAQGKTLDKACFDRGSRVFDHGQLYVALSRTRTKADLYIARPLVESDVKYDKRVLAFLHST